jgi:hypothetical protein
MQASVFEQQNYDGGLYDSSIASEINRNYASTLINYDIEKKGALIPRDGFRKMGSELDGYPTDIFFYEKVNAPMVVTSAGSLYYYDDDWVQLADNLTGDICFEVCPVDGKLYLISDTFRLKSWDGVTLTLNTCLVNATTEIYAKKIKWYKNHMFFSNTVTLGATTYKNRVYISNLGVADTVTSTDYLEPSGRGDITTCEELGDSALAFFKSQSVFFLTGYGLNSWEITTTNNGVQNVDNAIGCISVKGVTRVGNELWFVDDQGMLRNIYQTDFDPYRKDFRCNNVQGTLDKVNKSLISKSVLWYANDKVYWAVPTIGANNDLLLVNSIIAANRNQTTEAWTTYSATCLTPNALSSLPTSTGNKLIFASATEKYVYIQDSAGDGADADGTNGLDIECRYDTKDDDFDKPERYKRYFTLNVWGKATSVDCYLEYYCSLDGKAFGLIDTFNLNPQAEGLGPTGTFKLGPTGKSRLVGLQNREKRIRYDSGSAGVKGKSIQHSIRYTGQEKPTITKFTCSFRLRPLV